MLTAVTGMFVCRYPVIDNSLTYRLSAAGLQKLTAQYSSSNPR